MNKRTSDHFTGCLLGGAAGDALGAAVEFMSIENIRSTFGPEGIVAYAEAYGRRGAITDDTQMTLFTAEGLILSHVRQENASADKVVAAVYHAYLRWLFTQEAHQQGRLVKDHGSCAIMDGILIGHKALHARRAPGNTCLSALRSGKMGDLTNPINDSKGCGGVMRVAPVGLAYQDLETAFQIGSQCAAITHGHPSGFLAAGVLAAIIAGIISGQELAAAVHQALDILKTRRGHAECLAAIQQALAAVSLGPPTPKIITSLGAGWIAEEALAIGIYCALTADGDFRKGVLAAVNHGGDSDSTGAITGNILGAWLGVRHIPQPWLEELELRDLIAEIADDLKTKCAENHI